MTLTSRSEGTHRVFAPVQIHTTDSASLPTGQNSGQYRCGLLFNNFPAPVLAESIPSNPVRNSATDFDEARESTPNEANPCQQDMPNGTTLAAGNSI
jgi:hypothetical protein